MFNQFCACNITDLAVAVFVLRFVTPVQKPRSYHSRLYKNHVLLILSSTAADYVSE
jgi:hypothetical protein